MAFDLSLIPNTVISLVSQPSTIQPGDTSANGRTQCQKVSCPLIGSLALIDCKHLCSQAQFIASSDGPAAPTLCGTLSGQHMIIEAREDCNEVSGHHHF